jgi:hypothetical protein
MIRKVYVFGKIVEVEFSYEEPERGSNYIGGYEVYEIDDIPSHFFTNDYISEVIRRLEELRSAR